VNQKANAYILFICDRIFIFTRF